MDRFIKLIKSLILIKGELILFFVLVSLISSSGCQNTSKLQPPDEPSQREIVDLLKNSPSKEDPKKETVNQDTQIPANPANNEEQRDLMAPQDTPPPPPSAEGVDHSTTVGMSATGSAPVGIIDHQTTVGNVSQRVLTGGSESPVTTANGDTRGAAGDALVNPNGPWNVNNQTMTSGDQRVVSGDTLTAPVMVPQGTPLLGAGGGSGGSGTTPLFTVGASPTVSAPVEVTERQATTVNTSRPNPNLDNLGKKVIWFSPAFPTTQYIANHRTEIDQLPVDGLVFDVLLNRSLSPLTQPIRFGPDNTLGRLLFAHSNGVAGSVVRLDPSDPNLVMSVSDMVEEKTSGRHNFLSVSVGRKAGYYRSETPLNLRPPAWNDDVGWANATANWELAARIAKQTGARGLVIDFEPYPYDGLYDRNGNPIEDYVFNEYLYPGYQSIARARGRQIMQAMRRVFPDIVLIVPWGYSATLRNKPNWPGFGDHFNKMAVTMSYVKNFLDGMLESIPDGSLSRILDGYEFSYWYRTPADFNEGVNEIVNVVPQQNVAGDIRSRYASYVAPAFAFWLDWKRSSPPPPPPSPPQCPQWLADNRMNSAQQTEIMVGAGLHHSGQYSWIYAEEATLLNDLWWNSCYRPVSNVDASYLNALWKAKGTDFGVRGLVEGIDWSSGSPLLRGWACRRGYPSPLNINISFRDSSGALLPITNTFVADEPSEPEISDVCGSKGRRFRFSIPLAPFSATFVGKEILVSPADSFGLGTLNLASAGPLIQPGSGESGAGRPAVPVWSEVRSLSDRSLNLLSNPGFETELSWQASLLGPAGSATTEIISSDSYSGSRSARLNLVTPDASARWYQDFFVPGQRTLGLKIHYKTSVDFTGSAEASLVTEETTYRLPLSPTRGGWQQAELGAIFINTSGMRPVQLLLNGVGGRGRVTFDSVELSSVETGLTPASLVSDAGFEHGSPFWQTSSASGEYYFLIDKEVSKTGRYSARITTSFPGQGRWYQKGISVVRGHTYRLSIAVKTSGPEDPFPFTGSVAAWVRCDDGALGACNRNYSTFPTGGQWKTISGDFIPNTDTVTLYLNSFGENVGGSVWFDDITVTE